MPAMNLLVGIYARWPCWLFINPLMVKHPPRRTKIEGAKGTWNNPNIQFPRKTGTNQPSTIFAQTNSYPAKNSPEPSTLGPGSRPTTL